MKAFDAIKIIKRPGDLNAAGRYILKEVMEFADKQNIDVLDEVTIERVLYVAIGGDGTMLRAMDESMKQNYSVDTLVTSVIGFHAGTLGFLTEDAGRLSPSFMLDQILNGGDWLKPNDHLVLETTIDGRLHFAINEFTFTPSSTANMLYTRVDINGKFVTELNGSGILVSTATGSTAMAMSAGGAIISPSTNVMQVVPLMPHSLVSRPIVTAADDVISIETDMEMSRVKSVHIHSDGRILRRAFRTIQGPNRVAINIKRAQFPVRVWYREERDFFQVLSNKLEW